jgi:Flp pilus assembly protein TadG
MKKTFVSRSREHGREHGITMILVAAAMVAIIGMAVLSIDVVTLYLAKEEAQRSADAAALAAARLLSVSGITGDPANLTSNWAAVCGANGAATLVAQAVAAQNIVGNQASPTVTVTYSAGSAGTVGAGTSDCTSLSTSAFGVNPMVTVKVTQAGLPNFFSRIWSRSGNSVSATATAEAFNPSDSGNSGNQVSGTITPVRPRCVKPWVVPNLNPLIPAPVGAIYCNMAGGPGCHTLVGLTNGSITDAGIALNGGDGSHVIGETFWLVPDCDHGNPNNCNLLGGTTPVQPRANYNDGLGFIQGPPNAPNLLSAPGQVGTPVTAVPSCSGGDPYEEAIEGCDSPTNYQCGVTNAGVVDLTKHNPGVNSITNAVQCLIHQTDATNITSSSGQDYLKTTGAFGDPSAYPFQILAGSSNPLGGGLAGTPITSSNSIVSLPIYDQINGAPLASNTATNETFIGFLQVFINAVDGYGNRRVTVLNVSGCGNGTNPTGNPVYGSSPVPVRLITPP